MPSNAKSQEALYDQRLFNQSKASGRLCLYWLFFAYSECVFQGLDSGFSAEDDVYSVYDKPWRKGEAAGQAIYRPSKNIDKDVYGDDIAELIKTTRLDQRLSGLILAM